MENDRVSEILRNHRSYRYAAKIGEEFLDSAPTVHNERRKGSNRWDAHRYNSMVSIVDNAVNEVLTDEERTIVKRKYLDQNPLTLTQIAHIIGYERKSVGRKHKSALRKLSKALEPIEEDLEITPFEHMFDEKGEFLQ